jgi:hypothetical protein
MAVIRLRLWAIGGGGLLLLVAMAGIGNGCGSGDCNDTATCPITGDDVVVGDQGNFVASDAIVETGDDGSDVTVASNDGAPGADAQDSVSMGDDADATSEADGAMASNDALVEAAVDDAADAAEAADAKDAFVEAKAEASGPPCGSNLLAPTNAVSSSIHGSNVAMLAIDHNFGTRWESAQSIDPQWIYLDFGRPVSINRVQIAWETSCAQNYDLQTSNDTQTWTTIFSVLGNMSGTNPGPADWTTALNHTGFLGVGRYLRVFGTARCIPATNYGYSMWEMQVSGDTNTSCHA